MITSKHNSVAAGLILNHGFTLNQSIGSNVIYLEKGNTKLYIISKLKFNGQKK